MNEIIYHGTIDGKKALRMRPDSGADRSIVHRRMVPTSALSGKKGFFKSFSGHNSQLDLAEVTIAIAGEQYTVEVAVSDTLQYDALLGMDLPDLFKPLQQKASESIMSVSTRAQLRQAAEEQQEVARREKEDAATPTPLPTTESTTSSNSIHSPDTDRDKEEDDGSEIDPSPISDDDGDEEEDDLRAIDLPPFSEDLFLQVRPSRKSPRARSVKLHRPIPVPSATHTLWMVVQTSYRNCNTATPRWRQPDQQQMESCRDSSGKMGFSTDGGPHRKMRKLFNSLFSPNSIDNQSLRRLIPSQWQAILVERRPPVEYSRDFSGPDFERMWRRCAKDVCNARRQQE